MDPGDCRVGMRVLFGRARGQKTLAEIIQVNPRLCKVRTLEGRGKRDRAGQIWRVGYNIMQPAKQDIVDNDTIAAECAKYLAEVMPTFASPEAFFNQLKKEIIPFLVKARKVEQATNDLILVDMQSDSGAFKEGWKSCRALLPTVMTSLMISGYLQSQVMQLVPKDPDEVPKS